MSLSNAIYGRLYIGGYDFSDPKERRGFKRVLQAGALKHTDVAPHSPAIYIEVCLVAFDWRVIHKWFVTNVQNGVDDCREYDVEREQLEELLQTVRDVLRGGTKSYARFLLPGPTTRWPIDEWYWEGLRRTEKKLKKLLNNPRLSTKTDWTFRYHSSW